MWTMLSADNWRASAEMDQVEAACSALTSIDIPNSMKINVKSLLYDSTYGARKELADLIMMQSESPLLKELVCDFCRQTGEGETEGC